MKDLVGKFLNNFNRPALAGLKLALRRPRVLAVLTAGLVVVLSISLLTWSVELRDDVRTLQRKNRSLVSELNSVASSIDFLEAGVELNSENLDDLSSALFAYEVQVRRIFDEVDLLDNSIYWVERDFSRLELCVESIAEWVMDRSVRYIYC